MNVDTDGIFESHRRRLFNLAYRMLGTVAEAEDVVQEAWLRWFGHQDQVREPGPWLSRTTTRLCLDYLRSARHQRERYVGPWLPEPVRTDGENPVGARLENAESLSQALMVLLEQLSPPERAAWILREVFDHPYAEVAEMVGTSATHCRQLVSRAKGHLRASRTRFDVSEQQRQRLLQRFSKAVAEGDLAGLTQVLAADCTLYSDGGGKALAALKPIFGSDKVIRFFFGLKKKASLQLEVSLVAINGEPGLLLQQNNQPVTVFTLGLNDQGQIQEIYVSRNPDKMQYLA